MVIEDILNDPEIHFPIEFPTKKNSISDLDQIRTDINHIIQNPPVIRNKELSMDLFENIRLIIQIRHVNPPYFFSYRVFYSGHLKGHKGVAAKQMLFETTVKKYTRQNLPPIQSRRNLQDLTQSSTQAYLEEHS
jgi:hypothetical protein